MSLTRITILRFTARYLWVTVASTAAHGKIVSSISATTPTPYETVYGPSKAFGFSFAESLREELKDTGVSVTALLPGATDSEFHANAGMANTGVGQLVKNGKSLVARQAYEALINGEGQRHGP